MTKKSSGSDFIVGAIIGGLIGAATALFLAPKTGKELRADLNESASSIKGLKTIAEKGSELAEVAKEKTISLSQVVAEQSSNIIEMFKDATNQVQDKGTSSNDVGSDLLDEATNSTTVDGEFIPLKTNDDK